MGSGRVNFTKIADRRTGVYSMWKMTEWKKQPPEQIGGNDEMQFSV